MSKTRKKYMDVPGTLIKCQSGRYMAFYEHRSDIVANGENAKEAKKNLKEMYSMVLAYEEEENKKKSIESPIKEANTKHFIEKIPIK